MTESQITKDEVFVETSVLVDFVQLASVADCWDLFKSKTNIQKVASPEVNEEFTRKRENREYIVKKFQEQIAKGTNDFSDLELPHQDRFSEKDEQYAKDLLEKLAQSSETEAEKELVARRKRFKKGSKVLFDSSIGILNVFPAEKDPHLLGNLRKCVSNDSDRRIIAEAIDWAQKREKEVLISEDKDDFTNNESDINEAIDFTRSFDVQLQILVSSRFLSLVSSD